MYGAVPILSGVHKVDQSFIRDFTLGGGGGGGGGHSCMLRSMGVGGCPPRKLNLLHSLRLPFWSQIYGPQNSDDYM